MSHASAAPSRTSVRDAVPQASPYSREPLSASRRSPASRTVRAIGPGASWLPLIGTTPSVGSRPTVGLRPTQPLSELGQVIDPSVSVPTARGVRPPATAAPDPDDDPPALRSSAHGLPVRPPSADQPLVDRDDRMFAHSDRFVAPRTMSPASRRRSTSGASWLTIRSASANDPAEPGRPTASMLSLISTGTPCNGPRTWPAARSASRLAATSSAPGASASTARRCVSPGPSSAAIRSSRARVTATDVVRPAARSSPSSAAVARANAAEAGWGSLGLIGGLSQISEDGTSSVRVKRRGQPRLGDQSTPKG